MGRTSDILHRVKGQMSNVITLPHCLKLRRCGQVRMEKRVDLHTDTGCVHRATAGVQQQSGGWGQEEGRRRVSALKADDKIIF